VAPFDSAERGAFGVDRDEAVLPRDGIEAGTRAHDLGASHAAMQHDHGRALLARSGRVHDDRATVCIANFE